MNHNDKDIIHKKRYSLRFTLIELLLVVAILSILMTLLLPALNIVKQRSKQIVCANQLKQIGLGIHGYAGDFDGFLPPYYAGAYTYVYHSYGDDYYGPVTWRGLGSIYRGGYIGEAKFNTDKRKINLNYRNMFYCPASTLRHYDCSIPGTREWDWYYAENHDNVTGSNSYINAGYNIRASLDENGDYITAYHGTTNPVASSNRVEKLAKNNCAIVAGEIHTISGTPYNDPTGIDSAFHQNGFNVLYVDGNVHKVHQLAIYNTYTLWNNKAWVVFDHN